MKPYRLRFNGRVLVFNAGGLQDAITMLARWVRNHRRRNRHKPDNEGYWFSVGLAILIMGELTLFAFVIHAWANGGPN